MARSITWRLAGEELAPWRVFLRSHAQVMAALDREHQAAGLVPLTWFDVLVQLDRGHGRLRMNQLADAVVLSRSGVTRLVDRMEREGLVLRQPCPSDRRGLEAVLTPAGRTALKRALPVHLAGVEEHFLRHLDQAERRRVGDALARVLDDRNRSRFPAARPGVRKKP